MDKSDLREKLADYAHEAWSGWMKYMASKGRGMTSQRQTRDQVYWTQIELPSALLERWERQVNTPYAGLPEGEKDSDRAEADKMIAIFQAHEDELLKEIDTLRLNVIDLWHATPQDVGPLHEAMNMTWEEYKKWVEGNEHRKASRSGE